MKKGFVYCFSALCTLFLCCAFVLGCNDNRLDAPQGVSVDGDAQILSWNGVENASNYVISIGDKMAVSSKTTYSLTGLAAGTYNIRVKASDAKKQYDDSEWSASVVFVKPPESGITYTLINANTEYQVSGIGTARGEVTIPDYYKGKPVTAIADRAFYAAPSLSGVKLGERIKSIGNYAFTNCSNLAYVEIPSGVTSIGLYAFQGCRALREIEVPSGVAALNSYTFRYCKNLQTVKLNDGVRLIGEEAFADCDRLEEIVLPDSVLGIDDKAFYGCDVLQRVSLGEGVVAMGERIFGYCPALAEVSGGARLTDIGEGAFTHCESLTSFVVPTRVETIGGYAFDGCKKLESITIGLGVSDIGRYAFRDTPIMQNKENGLVYAGRWVVGYDNDAQEPPNEFTFRNDTIGIAQYAFYRAKVENVTLPASLRYINDYAFSNCENLMSLSVGDNVESIGRYAFAFCSHLGRSTVSLGNGITGIGSYAFYGCTDLGAATVGFSIPQSVESIGTYAFKKTNFWENPQGGFVEVGDWVVGFDENASSAAYSVRTGIVGIADYAFYKWETLKSISLPYTLKYLGKNAFNGCSELIAVNFDDSDLTEIREYTFYKCANLTVVDIPSGVESIGRSAFYKSGVADANIPKWVESIGDYAYYGCASLHSLTFADGSQLKSIGAYAFSGCAALPETTLPDGLTTVGERAFSKCTALGEVTFGEQLAEIAAGAFYGCAALTAVQLPDGLTRIGDKAFYKCAALADVHFGKNLNAVGEYAFYGCTALTRLRLPASLTHVGAYAFRKCAGLTAVILPTSIEYIGSHAFNGCKTLTLYCQGQAGEAWDARWNSGYRPVLYGCEISEDGSYVTAFVKTEGAIENENAANGFSAPKRDGYTFGGWQCEDGTAETGELVGYADGTRFTAVWTPNDEQ